MEQVVAQTLARIDRRGAVEEEAAKVELCDGTDPAATKAYLRCVQLCPRELQPAVLKRTARGPLLRETVRWLQDHEFDFAAYRGHVLQAFVAHDVQGIARAELQSVARQPGEKVLSYNRRFREAADEAYPGARNEEQNENLVRLYAMGLRDSTKATKIISTGWPATLEDAMRRVAEKEVQASNLQRLGLSRQEEPMDVDAYGPRKPVSSQQDKELHLLKTQYGKLEAKMDRLLERLANQTPAATSSTMLQKKKKRAEDRTCYGCGDVGHIRRHCPKEVRQPPVAAATSSGAQSSQ